MAKTGLVQRSGSSLAFAGAMLAAVTLAASGCCATTRTPQCQGGATACGAECCSGGSVCLAEGCCPALLACGGRCCGAGSTCENDACAILCSAASRARPGSAARRADATSTALDWDPAAASRKRAVRRATCATSARAPRPDRSAPAASSPAAPSPIVPMANTARPPSDGVCRAGWREPASIGRRSASSSPSSSGRGRATPWICPPTIRS